MEQIIIKNLSKSYGTLTVLKNVDLTLDRYKTYCLMSPSGTGKTTLFRILMGLEKADEGDIIWNVGSGAGTETDTDASRSLRISVCFPRKTGSVLLFPLFGNSDDGAEKTMLLKFTGYFQGVRSSQLCAVFCRKNV